ncbi:nitroreductase/quinone reductase family protein [Jatrophihabitans endophyticus]|uniref:nitroreductase/quinone reductase family protein n=1 Tax=Jatrophihabitans endophyticus TaxID=1206085 RepID=UPI0019EEC358|nr:nitroreductase/quinone reductase family protein [Jatrophihabitans endophyticus]MBE7189244.1 nitroreductase family deazaflavin-dependent oxidoreductase [Jatrophihabitans endophyticus]
MRDDVKQALDIGPNPSVAERTIDITTTGRRSGLARRIEICFYRVDDEIYLSGVPGERRRDWLTNLVAEPSFAFHLKNGVVADLDATATEITDPAERRRVLAPIAAAFDERHDENSPWPRFEFDAWLERAPLARVDFVDD